MACRVPVRLGSGCHSLGTLAVAANATPACFAELARSTESMLSTRRRLVLRLAAACVLLAGAANAQTPPAASPRNTYVCPAGYPVQCNGNWCCQTGQVCDTPGYCKNSSSASKSNNASIVAGIIVPVVVLVIIGACVRRCRSGQAQRIVIMRQQPIPATQMAAYGAPMGYMQQPMQPMAPGAMQLNPMMVNQAFVQAPYMPQQQQQQQPAPIPISQATVQGVPVQGVASSKATSQLMDWLEQNRIPLTVMNPLSSAGVASLDDLKYLTDSDIEALGFSVVVRNKLLAGIQGLKCPGPPEEGPASV